jgi:hypothetical protein
MEKRMIDKFIYKFFGVVDNFMLKLGEFLYEGHKTIGKLFKKRKRKK